MTNKEAIGLRVAVLDAVNKAEPCWGDDGVSYLIPESTLRMLRRSLNPPKHPRRKTS